MNCQIFYQFLIKLVTTNSCCFQFNRVTFIDIYTYAVYLYKSIWVFGWKKCCFWHISPFYWNSLKQTMGLMNFCLVSLHHVTNLTNLIELKNDYDCLPVCMSVPKNDLGDVTIITTTFTFTIMITTITTTKKTKEMLNKKFLSDYRWLQTRLW